MARDDDTDSDPPPSPWPSSLPPKIAAAILRRLPSHADRVRFAAVCRPWRAAAAHLPRRPPLPWLAVPDGTFFSFPSPTALRFPSATAGYLGSCDDWLLFDGGAGAGEDGYRLANPFTGETARLPPLSRVRFVVGDGGAPLGWRSIAADWRAPFGAAVRKLAMGLGGRVAAAMVGDGRLGKIAMCKIAGASSWVMSGHDTWRGITDMAFYDGKVYAVENTGDLLAMPTGVDARSGEPTVAWARCVVKASDHASPATARRCSKQGPPPSTRHLLVHGGKLMMVHRTTTVTGTGGGATAKFAVFAADLAAARWSEVASVGDDTALFVGRWRSLARRVSPYGMPGNRIHFLDDDDRCSFSRGCRGKFGSYDMKDGKTYPLLPTLELRNNGSGGTSATWLFPGDDQEVTQWCDLPYDVLGLVLGRVRSREDRARLSEVCRDWCASARQHLRTGTSRPSIVV
ncbi:unnamed protein product [Urochloa decumbens]|uniref:F-box domain-containing protein n=1 Tax=Urochloa decumbens TaxID=240449 RepID=A0ABC9BYL0_9POAL